jgi:glycosyltransferase involved in cell wall biosynthesis
MFQKYNSKKEERFVPVSVIMSVYNAQHYVSEAIESILGQSYENFEFIIINDGSTDNSYEIIESYNDNRIKILNQDNIGLAASLNRGLNVARGKYVARMDADDISAQNRLEEQFKYMEYNQDCVAVGSNINIISKEGEYLDYQVRPDDSNLLKSVLPFDTPFAHGSAFIRMCVIKNVGGYKPEMRFSQDVILWLDMKEYGKYGRIQKPLYTFRVVPESNQNKSKKVFHIKKKILSDYSNNGYLDRELIRSIPDHGGGLSKNRKYHNYYMIIGYYYKDKCQDNKNAKKCFIQALRYWKVSPYAAYAILILLIGYSKKII